MNIVMTVALTLALGSSAAADCQRYTHGTRPLGEVVAEITDDRVLTIADKFGSTDVYDLVSAGTGIEYMEGQPRPEVKDRATIAVLEHKGDLLIDMMVFTPYCKIE